MAILPKVIYRFSEITIKIPIASFTDLEQILQKFMWDQTKIPNSNNNLEKEEKNWRDDNLI